MRGVVLLCVIFLWCGAWCASSQEAKGGSEREITTIFTKIAAAVEASDSQALVPLLFERVYISIDDNTARYSRKKAKGVLNKFFTKNPPTDYSYIHHGSSSEQQVYYIARYVSSAASYRVSWFFKRQTGSYRVYSISFTKETS